MLHSEGEIRDRIAIIVKDIARDAMNGFINNQRNMCAELAGLMWAIGEIEEE